MNLEWIAIFAAVLALCFFWLFVRNLKKRRLFSSGLHLLLTSLSAVIAALALAVSLHLYTYARLTAEQSVAIVKLRQIGPQQYNLTLDVPEKASRLYVIDGDEWQLDARVLKWHGWAQLLGLDAQFRLDRLSGRFQDVAMARSQLPTVHDLAGDDGPLDIWALARRKPSWLPWVDAEYGSATYLPLEDDAWYEVKLTQTGLLARPINTAATKAVTNW